MMASNAVAVRDQHKDPIRQAVDAMAPEFKAALPAHVSVDKFVRVSMTAINSNPDLRNADRRSLFGAVTRLAQDGLLPDGREAALVIFNTKANGEWVKKVQAMPMVAGLLKMMRQSGEVAWVDAHVVRQNDHFQYRPGLDDVPVFEPDWFGERGDVIGAYAIARLKSGEIVPPEIMSRAQIEEVRAVSRAKDKGPWVDWFDQMALKTVLRRYLKRLPTSTDLLDAFDRDETMATTIEPRIAHHEPEVPPMPPVSRLDALEHHIEEEADAEPVDEAEHTATLIDAPLDEAQSELTVRLDLIKERIANAANHKALKAVEADWLNAAAAYDDDTVAEVEAMLTEQRKTLDA